MDGGNDDDVLVMRFAGTLFGGPGDDVLNGDGADTPSETFIHCGPGTDRVDADVDDTIDADCEDVTVHIFGTDAADTIVGTVYKDDVVDFGGDDSVSTGKGDDNITLELGKDTVDAGEGDDVIYAFWGSRFRIVGDVDSVTCGPGDDTAYVDDVDTVASDCERVYVSTAPK